MMKFTNTYPNGSVEEEITDDKTVKQYINRKYGSMNPEEHGVTVEGTPLTHETNAPATHTLVAETLVLDAKTLEEKNPGDEDKK